MEHKTDSAQAVTSTLNIKHLIGKAFYFLSQSIPRRMPGNDQDFEHMKFVLRNYFGLEDTSETWLIVYGQLLSSPVVTGRFTYKKLATAGHRLRLNKFINDKKGLEIEKLKSRLEALVEKINEDQPTLPERAHDLQGEVQSLHGAQEGVVFDANPDGVY